MPSACMSDHEDLRFDVAGDVAFRWRYMMQIRGGSKRKTLTLKWNAYQLTGNAKRLWRSVRASRDRIIATFSARARAIA